MPNEKNLVPFGSGQSREKARENGAKGGVASGISKRRKKSLREAAEIYLSLPVSDRRAWNKLAKDGVCPEDVDNQMAIIAGLSWKAAKGDAKAAKVLFELLPDGGGKPDPGELEDDPITKALKEDAGNGAL